MGLQTEFLSLTVDALPAFAADRKREGWRFVQLLAVVTDGGFDLVYSFMKDGVLENYTIQDVTKDTAVPSITDQFLAAFVFENEVHDLFGINVKGIAIDFGGTFYQLSQKEPMTIISPEQKAAREKAAEGGRGEGRQGAGGPPPTPRRRRPTRTAWRRSWPAWTRKRPRRCGRPWRPRRRRRPLPSRRQPTRR